MAKGAKSNARTRPARKIKLNRSIFNAGFQGEPVFRGRTLSEVKNEPEETKTTDNLSAVTTNTNNTTIVNPTATSPSQNAVFDTRTVVNVYTKKNLMQPTIKLTRISSGNYSRSVSRGLASSPGNGNIRRVFSAHEGRVSHSLTSPENTDISALPQSPAKKRKISPIRSPVNNLAENIEQQVVDTAWDNKFDDFIQVSTNLESPVSPALSIGAEFDGDLHGDLQTNQDERVFIKTTSSTPSTGQKRQQKLVLKPPISPVKKKWANLAVSSTTAISSSYENDQLDVMSVLADDDDLFKEDGPKLKRSLSQDSVFNMNDGWEDRGDLRSLLKKDTKSKRTSQTGPKHTVGDIISKKGCSKSFKIPTVCHQNGGNLTLVNGLDLGNSNVAKGVQSGRRGHVIDGSPKGNIPGSNQSGNVKPPSYAHQANILVGKLKISLQKGNVGEAWCVIRQLDQMKLTIDRRSLEEMLKVCERITSCNISPAPIVTAAALGVFEQIKKQGDLKPADYMVTILVLSRCRKFDQAMGLYRDMIACGRLPPENILGCFLTDLCKALAVAPSRIIEVIIDVLKFSFVPEKKTNFVNCCLSFLIGSPRNQHQDIKPDQWNQLLTMLCTPPSNNFQGASQVRNLMEQCEVPIATAVIIQLMKFYQNTNSIRLLLNLVNSKQIRALFEKPGLPSDLTHFLMSPKVNTRDIESCFASMIKENNQPTKALLELFIQKASHVSDYSVIYQLFLKYQKAMLLLPVSILQQMMDVLDKWDENTDASVQVYAILRKARKLQKQTSAEGEFRKKPENMVNGEPVRECNYFMRTGKCRHGDRCHFAHHRLPSYNNDGKGESDHQPGHHSDNKSERRHGDGKRERHQSDGKSERRHSDGKSDHHSSDGKTDHHHSDGKTDRHTSGRSSNDHKQTRHHHSSSHHDSHNAKPNQLQNTDRHPSDHNTGQCEKIPPSNNSNPVNTNPGLLGANPFSTLQVLNSGIASQLFRPPLFNPLAFVIPPGIQNPPQRTTGIQNPPQRTPGIHNPPQRTPGIQHPPQRTPGIQNPPQRTPGIQHPPQRTPGKQHHPQRPPGKQHHPTQRPPFQHRMQRLDIQPTNQLFPGKKPFKDVPKVAKSCPTSNASPVDTQKIGRSFSWEQTSTTSQGHLATQNSPVTKSTTDKNNNGKVFSEKQQHLEKAVRCNDWAAVYVCYVECKGTDSQTVQNEDLLLFRNGFVKSHGVGKSFSMFVDFVYKENNCGKSCHSANSHHDIFDQYDIEFIACLGVSLMQKCLDLKQFEEGYEVLLCLHNHNISYFNNGLNFGAYTKDIPPTNVSLIAVKLCLGIENHGCLSAMVVLNACNYGLPEDGEDLSPDKDKYRIKVLKELFEQLLDQGFIDESIELINNVKRSLSSIGSMYTKIFEHCVANNDFDRSFAVLNTIQEVGFEFDKNVIVKLYESCLSDCVETKHYGKGISLVHEMGDRGVQISHSVLREMLHNLKLPEEESLAQVIFDKCQNSNIYPETYSDETPWLCELGCGFSQVELKLLIQNHLRQIHEHLIQNLEDDELLTSVQELQIVLYPRLASDVGLKFDQSNQKMLKSTTELVEIILQHELNPPLEIVKRSGEQFHKVIVVGNMSVYRWLTANIPNKQRFLDSQEEEDDVSSQVSLGSDLSDFELPWHHR